MSLLALVTGIAYLMTSKPPGTCPTDRRCIKEILPMLVKAVQEPDVLLISFAAFSLFVAYIGVMTFTADHLKSMLFLPSDKIGTMLSITGLSGIIVSPIAGLLGDRLGRQKRLSHEAPPLPWWPLPSWQRCLTLFTITCCSF
jgi:predicted MFS family arabinose efflux permease